MFSTTAASGRPSPGSSTRPSSIPPRSSSSAAVSRRRRLFWASRVAPRRRVPRCVGVARSRDGTRLVLDGWLPFRVTENAALAVLALRRECDAVLAAAVEFLAVFVFPASDGPFPSRARRRDVPRAGAATVPAPPTRPPPPFGKCWRSSSSKGGAPSGPVTARVVLVAHEAALRPGGFLVAAGELGAGPRGGPRASLHLDCPDWADCSNLDPFYPTSFSRGTGKKTIPRGLETKKKGHLGKSTKKTSWSRFPNPGLEPESRA